MKSIIARKFYCGMLSRVGLLVAIVMPLIARPNVAASCAPADHTDLLAASPSSLYGQSLASLFQQSFDRDGVSYILIEGSTGSPIAAHWPNHAQNLPFGSLVKPFTALAYARSHAGHYPEFDCAARDGCWRSGGHGRLDLPHAVAFSCNAYFLKLAAAIPPEAWSAILQEFHLQSPSAFGLRELVGLGDTSLADPIEVVQAYAELARDTSRPGAREILEGMALSASVGTGQAAGRAILPRKALVKTGTGPCVHARRGQGDGYAIAPWPPDSPRYGLLVQLHNAPGAKAAELAGAMLRAVQGGE